MARPPRDPDRRLEPRWSPPLDGGATTSPIEPGLAGPPAATEHIAVPPEERRRIVDLVSQAHAAIGPTSGHQDVPLYPSNCGCYEFGVRWSRS